MDGEVPFIAMKLIEGETLAKRISTARDGGNSTCVMFSETGEAPPIPAERRATATPGRAEVMRVVQVFEQAARAVHAAHEAGVIHRDLKPGNMMVTPDGQPVILDFGLAEELDSENPTLTISGDLLGTLHYMSPEQIAAKRIRLDRRTDVWSLGAALYEALTLKKPFESPTRDGLLQAIMTKEPVDPRQINRAIPTDLRTVIETCSGEGSRPPIRDGARPRRGPASCARRGTHPREARKLGDPAAEVVEAESCPRDGAGWNRRSPGHQHRASDPSRIGAQCQELRSDRQDLGPRRLRPPRRPVATAEARQRGRQALALRASTRSRDEVLG